MKKYSTVLLVMFCLIVLFLTSSCALTKGRNLVSDNTVNIERIASKRAVVMNINVRQIDSELSIFGTIKKRHSAGRGVIPGHIDIELVDPNGKTENKTNITYYRKSTKSRKSYFHVEFDAAPVSNTTIRVIHHAGIPAQLDQCENHPALNCKGQINKKTL